MRESVKNKLAIRLDDGKLIYRSPKFVQFGNFQMIIVKVGGEDYLVGDGDEYIRGGLDKEFTLGRKLSKHDRGSKDS